MIKSTQERLDNMAGCKRREINKRKKEQRRRGEGKEREGRG